MGLLSRFILSVCGLFLLSGCVTMPNLHGISSAENKEVRSRFKKMVVAQRTCHYCLDGTAHVTLTNILYSGAISGYLQAMSPSYLKFVGVNPLGQPLAVFTTNGQQFRYVSTEDTTVYNGEVNSETFSKYTPEGFVPALSYYWLIGRLQPGPVQLTRVSRDETRGYWVELLYENGRKALLLFDPDTLQIQRHIVLNGNGERILNILYEQYGEGECEVPRQITVTSLTLDSSMEIHLGDLLEDVSLSLQDFDYSPPPTFKEVLVE